MENKQTTKFMKIAITGTNGIAKATHELLCKNHNVSMLDKKNYNINNVELWATEFFDYDIIINCAYSGFAQTKVLENFYNMWKTNPSKKIINIGSMITTYTRTQKELNDLYWDYRVHKQALELSFNSMVTNTQCEIKLINFGPVETSMSEKLVANKFSPSESAQYIINIMNDPNIKRVDLWK